MQINLFKWLAIACRRKKAGRNSGNSRNGKSRKTLQSTAGEPAKRTVILPPNLPCHGPTGSG
jgi:hypothetical protein